MTESFIYLSFLLDFTDYFLFPTVPRSVNSSSAIMIEKNEARNAITPGTYQRRCTRSFAHSLHAQNHHFRRRGHSMPPRSRKLNFSGKFFFRKLKK
jgi:hypothetical protein